MDDQVSSLMVSIKKTYLSVVFASCLIRFVYILHNQHAVFDKSALLLVEAAYCSELILLL